MKATKVTGTGLESATLREVAYHRLRDAIITCRLGPGQQFTERQLVTETGLGISPIREALTRLDHEGLVRTLPRKGYQVKPLTIKTVNDLFEYWRLLGPEIARRGVLGATPEQLEQARDCLKKLARLFSEAAPSTQATPRAVQLSEGFFTVLAESTHNEYLIAAYRRLTTEIARVWALTMDSDIMDGADRAETAKWPKVLDRRDGEAAAELSRQYIQESHNRVLRTLARWPSVVNAEIVPPNPPGANIGKS
ncbi:GntR family transcriptional regulator [Nonomuraea wenchangensis]